MPEHSGGTGPFVVRVQIYNSSRSVVCYATDPFHLCAWLFAQSGRGKAWLVHCRKLSAASAAESSVCCGSGCRLAKTCFQIVNSCLKQWVVRGGCSWVRGGGRRWSRSGMTLFTASKSTCHPTRNHHSVTLSHPCQDLSSTSSPFLPVTLLHQSCSNTRLPATLSLTPPSPSCLTLTPILRPACSVISDRGRWHGSMVTCGLRHTTAQ